MLANVYIWRKDVIALYDKVSTREVEMSRTYSMHVKTSNAYKIVVENIQGKRLFMKLRHK
jgi:hypothetical protein